MSDQAHGRNMRGVYDQFDIAMCNAAVNGTAVDQVIAKKRGGYIIYMKPSQEIVDFVSKFLSEAKTVTDKLVVYQPITLHTTLSDYKVKDDFDPLFDPDHKSDKEQLDLMVQYAREGLRKLEPAKCHYADFVFNTTTLILKGFPTTSFIQAAKLAIESATSNGITLRMPWGGHITLGRFGEGCTQEEAKALAQLCEEKSMRVPVLMQPFETINCGYFTVSGLKGGSQFHLHPISSYSLLD